MNFVEVALKIYARNVKKVTQKEYYKINANVLKGIKMEKME